MTDKHNSYHSSFRQPTSQSLLPSDLLVDNVVENDYDNDGWDLSSSSATTTTTTTTLFPNSTATSMTTSTTTTNPYFLRRSLQSRGYSRSPSNHDSIRLSFLIPLILMILCIISGACRQPAHANSRVAPNQPPLELSDEEKKKKQEKAQELRRQRLIQSFEVNNVLMVVKEENIKEQIVNNASTNIPTETTNEDDDKVQESQLSTCDIEEGRMENITLDVVGKQDDDFTETEDDTTQLYIPSHRRKSPQQCCMVSNLCAICLDSFHVDDVIVWSSNIQCQHVFHEFCVIDYLVKVKKNKGQPCPTCRQNFIDLIDMNKLSNNNEDDMKKKTSNNDNETRNNNNNGHHTVATSAAAAPATSETSDDTDDTDTDNGTTDATTNNTTYEELSESA